MNPWGPYGIPAWMAIWAELLSASADANRKRYDGRLLSDAIADISNTAGFYTDDDIEKSVSELREDLELLTPDDLTIGRGR